MREQKTKSPPLFPNTGETKFTANYLYAVCTPLPFGRGWGWAPPSFSFIREGLGVGSSSFLLIREGLGVGFSIHQSRVEQT
ncbi:hypothetical protein HMPREF9944_01006 [Segatella maculosa OT 289]|uniref:Uncharacterized protein n=1 Tax=Segatella maculosa OT 289 TaxID=999422 RepID=H1HLG2_9BACT|nr:hypothetical protein HMPREF9944_01006 [Segatella maculosa OT 289]